MVKKGIPNLSLGLRNTPSSSKIEMARLNTIISSLRVIVDLPLEPGPALLRGLIARTRQQNGGHSREGSPAALSRMQDAGGQDESVMDERDVDLFTPIGPVAMGRGTSSNPDDTLTDITDLAATLPQIKIRTNL
jgi:hypothetical protein